MEADRSAFAGRTGKDGAPEPWAPRFFTIFTGQAFSLFGSALVQFGLVWWLTRTTGSATVLATATIAAVLPHVLLGPFAGALVDRWDRKRVMILADAGIALSTLVLSLLFLLGLARPWHVFVILALRSLGSSFHGTALAASLSLIVPESQFTRVAGLRQALAGVNGIVAPPAGALLLGLLPMQGLLLIDVVTAAIAIGTLAFFAIPHPVAEEERGRTSFVTELKAGFDYVLSWPGLLALAILAMALNFLLSPAGSLMPLVVTKHFGKGALELGGLESLLGLGTIAGGLFLGAWGGFKRRMSTTILGVVGIGLAVLLVGLAPRDAFWLAGVAYLLLGFAGPVANGPIGAILQAVVKPNMQGRVFTLVDSAAMAMMPLSLALAGPLSDAFGLKLWFLAGGSLCIAFALAARSIPVLMGIEDSPPPEDRGGACPRTVAGTVAGTVAEAAGSPPASAGPTRP